MNFLNTLFLCILNLFFTFIGIVLNSVVIISLLHSQLRRKLCYFMILVLACFDLAVVAVLHPMVIFKAFGWSEGSAIIEGQLQILSLTALLTMTLERYVALVYPFFHQKHVTKSRLTAFLTFLQLPFASIHVMLQVGMRDLAVGASFLCLIGATFMATFFLNYKVLLVARKLRRNAMQMVPLGEFNYESEQSQCQFEAKQHNMTLKKISTCSLAVACFSVCYFPHFVYFLLKMTGQLKWSEKDIQTAHLWADTVLSMNSTFNCLIFFFMNSTLRRHGREIFQRDKPLCVGNRPAQYERQSSVIIQTSAL